MTTLFIVAFVAGAGALALWVDVRFPRLAPASVMRRFAAACGATMLVSVVPVTATVVSLVGMLLPTLALAFLTALWLLRVLADPAGHL